MVRTSGRLWCLDKDQTCVILEIILIIESDVSITSSYKLNEIPRIALHFGRRQHSKYSFGFRFFHVAFLNISVFHLEKYNKRDNRYIYIWSKNALFLQIYRKSIALWSSFFYFDWITFDVIHLIYVDWSRIQSRI